eukprot:TRINITY_DN11668_c1_g1_i1.p2 TRINITY_DN11668_c1_g1~~TRINITY_DN11668_c1_g1_i1.p2  ORF type:complete len:672 (+),score=239.79 TRINITY_DN11668_c1_g1_i1:83-2017(+)
MATAAELRAQLRHEERRRGELQAEQAQSALRRDAQLAALGREADRLRAELDSIAAALPAAPTAAQRAAQLAAERAAAAPPPQAAPAPEGSDEEDSASEGEWEEVGRIHWPHHGWHYAAGGARREGGCGVVCVSTPDKGRCLVAARDFAVGDLILGDTSVLDVAPSLGESLVTSKAAEFARGFLAAARAGEARDLKAVSARELEPGVVLMAQREKTGRAAEQGFDLDPVAVTGVPFRDGLLPVIIQYVDNLYRDPGHKCRSVFDLCCPLGAVPEHTAQSMLALGTAVAKGMRQRLPSHADALTPDRVARLLLTVQCNCIGVRRGARAGVAVFPFASLIEHSCAPCAVAAVLDETGDDGESLVEVRAVRPIARGEPISIDYVGACVPAAVRRRTLLQTHFFRCGCPPCAGEPDRTRAFWCPLQGAAPPLQAPPSSAEEADGLFCDACAALDRPPQHPVCCPVGDGARRWLSLAQRRELRGEVLAEAAACQRMQQAEEAAARAGAEAARRAAGGDWEGMERLAGHAVLHPTHHLVGAAAGEALIPVFREGDTRRTLWLLALLVGSTLAARGSSAVEQVAEYRELAAQAWLKAGDAARAAAHRGAACAVLRAYGLQRSVRGVDAAARAEGTPTPWRRAALAAGQPAAP